MFVATADKKGPAHLALAQEISPASPRHVVISAWLCPSAVANLQANWNISIVVWHAETDTGYQVLGCTEKLKDLGMLDGYLPARHIAPWFLDLWWGRDRVTQQTGEPQ